MKELITKALALVVLVGTSVVPPWEIPADAVRNGEEQAYEAEEATAYIEEEPEEPAMQYLGVYEVTAYEWTGSPCANGHYPEAGYTVACNSLPFGTRIYIEGVGVRVVEDRGADWHGESWIDLYLGDVDACYEWGVQSRAVYLLEAEE